MTTSPNRILGAIVGAVFVLVGALGFTVTGGFPLFATEGGLLFGLLTANPALNVLHILIGAALLLAALSSLRAAKTVNSVVGVLCLVLGLAGLFLIGSAFNVLAINVADNVLHFAAAVALLAVSLGAETTVQATPVQATPRTD